MFQIMFLTPHCLTGHFKKKMLIPWIEVKKKFYHTEYVQFQQSSKYKRIKFLKVDHRPIITGEKDICKSGLH